MYNCNLFYEEGEDEELGTAEQPLMASMSLERLPLILHMGAVSASPTTIDMDPSSRFQLRAEHSLRFLSSVFVFVLTSSLSVRHALATGASALHSSTLERTMTKSTLPDVTLHLTYAC